MTRRELFAASIGAALMAVVLVALQQCGGGKSTRRLPVAATSTGCGTAAGAASVGNDEAWRAANANLAQAVKLTQQRLEQNEVEKKALEKELKAAKAKLATAEGDGATPRNEFDLTRDDWKQLAKTGTVKARYPCTFDPDWHLGSDQVTSLGLSPSEVAVVETAYTNEEDRIASAIQPGCAKVLANAELTRGLGARVCTAVISESLKKNDPDKQLVADIMAGNIPRPPPDKLDPFATMLLAQAGSMQALQADLARTLGPPNRSALRHSPATAFPQLVDCRDVIVRGRRWGRSLRLDPRSQRGCELAGLRARELEGERGA